MILALLAIDVLVIGLFVNSRTRVIVAVILSDVFIATNNTITTQAVMVPEPLDEELVAA